MRALSEMTAGALRSLDVRDDAQRTYHRTVRTRLADTVWRSDGIRDGRHVTAGGFDPTVYPGLATDYAAQLATLRFSDYIIERAPTPTVVGALNGAAPAPSAGRPSDRKG